MSVSPELDHFFLAKRRAGDRWPSADRAGELAGGWQQHPASNQRRNPTGADSRSPISEIIYPLAKPRAARQLGLT